MFLTPYIAGQIWLCPYPVRLAGTRFGARMTVIRLASGELLLHSPCQITAAIAEEISALGPVAHIVAPGNFHHLFVATAQAAFPGARPAAGGDEWLQAKGSERNFGRQVHQCSGRPPGVGKTYLISKLVKSIFEETPDARILVSAQNHDTLMHMEDELRQELGTTTAIMLRVERSNVDGDESQLRATPLRAAAIGIRCPDGGEHSAG